MKHFKLEIDGVDYVWFLRDATDVMYQIGKYPGCDFMIYWQAPITRDYIRIVMRDNELITFRSDLKLPKVFSKLVSM